jgi:isoleucyl-tRNA synthetase
MRRVSDVLDCWFESGSMPFAQVHYPFENQEWFESHFPADFVVEYIGQTRGWFYTLHVLGTALFDKPAFTSCVAHGVVLGDDGRKASKRLRNFPDPDAAFSRYGADAIRWSLLSSSVLRGGNLIVSDRGMGEAVREAVLPVWNACHFFTTYANTGSRRAAWRTDSADVLDRYVLAKAHDLVAAATDRFEALDLAGACAAVSGFLDTLNNWYVRRSRRRFWGDRSGPDPDALDTLYTVLEVLLRTAAPLLPLIGDHLYRALTDGRSVHLTDWPDAEDLPADPDLVATMDRVRDVASAGHAIRKAQALKVRIPLPALTVAGVGACTLAPFTSLIADEVNVKEVRLTDDVSDAGDLVLSVLPKVAGPRLGGQVQQVLKAARAGEWRRDGDAVEVGGVALDPGEFELRLVPKDEATSRALAGDAALVVLDTRLTPELETEGRARDVVREIQKARREAGLDVSDRIRVRLTAPQETVAAVETHADWILAEVLADSLTTTVGLETEVVLAPS